jgi:hypothetical protein
MTVYRFKSDGQRNFPNLGVQTQPLTHMLDCFRLAESESLYPRRHGVLGTTYRTDNPHRAISRQSDAEIIRFVRLDKDVVNRPCGSEYAAKVRRCLLMDDAPAPQRIAGDIEGKGRTTTLHPGQEDDQCNPPSCVNDAPRADQGDPRPCRYLNLPLGPSRWHRASWRGQSAYQPLNFYIFVAALCWWVQPSCSCGSPSSRPLAPESAPTFPLRRLCQLQDGWHKHSSFYRMYKDQRIIGLSLATSASPKRQRVLSCWNLDHRPCSCTPRSLL